MTDPEEKVQCPLCENADAEELDEDKLASQGINAWECPTCGSFGLSMEILEDKLRELDSNQKSHISSYTRRKDLVGHPVPIICNHEIAIEEEGYSQIPLADVIDAFPGNVAKRLDSALLNMADLSENPGDYIDIGSDSWPLFYAENETAGRFFAEQLSNKGWLNFGTGFTFDQGVPPKEVTNFDKARLTADGWNRVAELQRSGVGEESTQGFVAMWFNDEMEGAYYDAIKPAIENAGFDPFRVDLKHHNNKICDEIIAEIRKSRFIVAEFTGQRGGVYFEAGFAIGLGIPVIFVCHEEDKDNLHFDTRQYSYIMWETHEGLRKQLRDRIEATIA